jgi:hypothetical protein
VWDQGKILYAHRVAWELTYGPIPEGMQVDHLCRNTLCVRATHLRLMTVSAHMAESAKYRARKMFCKRGHPLRVPDAQDSQGRCRACRRVA